MAANANKATIQSNIHNHTDSNLTKYALFMGGTNVINQVLQCYDPLRTGYGRLFMVRKPVWVDEYFKGDPRKPMEKFKHILEYGNTAVGGIQDIEVSTNSIQGGYTGKPFEIPSVAQDNTNSLTVTVYEFSGSPVREVLHTWINGTSDILTGLSHYNGIDKDSNGRTIKHIQANQTAEFIYVNTDVTGKQVEYACLFANCFPKGINEDVFNYTAGQHELVETQIEFTTTKYESTQINKVAQKLLNKYLVLTNSLNFYSGFDPDATDLGGSQNGTKYDNKTGQLVDRKS